MQANQKTRSRSCASVTLLYSAHDPLLHNQAVALLQLLKEQPAPSGSVEHQLAEIEGARSRIAASVPAWVQYREEVARMPSAAPIAIGPTGDALCRRSATRTPVSSSSALRPRRMVPIGRAGCSPETVRAIFSIEQLHRAGFANQPVQSKRSDDGLILTNALISGRRSMRAAR